MPQFSWRSFHVGVPTFLNKLFLQGVNCVYRLLHDYLPTSKAIKSMFLEFFSSLHRTSSFRDRSVRKKFSEMMILAFEQFGSSKSHFFADLRALYIHRGGMIILYFRTIFQLFFCNNTHNFLHISQKVIYVRERHRCESIY